MSASKLCSSAMMQTCAAPGVNHRVLAGVCAASARPTSRAHVGAGLSGAKRSVAAAPLWLSPISSTPRSRGSASGTAHTSTSVSTSLQTASADAASGIPVNFTVQVEASFGEVLKVVGSSPSLGSWTVVNAPMMTWTPGHVWQLQLLMEPGQVVEYKLARQSGTGVTWEGGPNRQLKVPKRLLMDDEELGGTTLISANLVWEDVAGSTVQIVVQQPSLSSVDLSDSTVPSPPPPTVPAVPTPPPVQASVQAPPAPAAPANVPRGSRFQENLSRTPGLTSSAPSAAGVPVEGQAPEPPPLEAQGGLIQPEIKPVKFRFKRLGSFDELQEQQQSSEVAAALPTAEEVAAADTPAPVAPSVPDIPAATAASTVADPTAEPTEPAAVPETPVSFRFRRVASTDEDDEVQAAEASGEAAGVSPAESAVTPAVSAAVSTPEVAEARQPEVEAAAVEEPVVETKAVEAKAEPAAAAAPAAPEATKASAKEETAESTSAEVVSQLNSLLEDNQSISGPQLRQLVYSKWKRHYDVQLAKLSGRMYFQVMWKFLEQKSFPMTEEQYDEKLDAIAYCISEWGVVDVVTSGIDKARGHPGYSIGGGAKCISIPLGVDLDGARRQEFSSSRR